MNRWGFDDVNGEIIGGFTNRVSLVSPNGNVQRETTLNTDESPSEWGEKETNNIKNELCGNGQPLSNYPHLIDKIYGSGKWEVRIYD